MPTQNGSNFISSDAKKAVKPVVKGKVVPPAKAGKVDPKLAAKGKVALPKMSEAKKTVAPVKGKGVVPVDKKGNPINTKGVKPLIKKADASIGPTANGNAIIHGKEQNGGTNPYPYTGGRDPVMGVGDGFDDVVRHIESLTKLCSSGR